ncbi:MULTISPECIES: sugar ABC transporter substrate-binding protein [Pseudomonas]|jgi:inositol transport system substrate-binding protein|uniref:Sugar ABC transporter substrate-binding protein n=1 Tax=Pseudomonas yamanorum TaxID=515393 RepID=A0A1H2IU20_9PSED|nr:MULTISPECIES: sugar ABC transporter substrate-binding protein [Pseudomonas]MBK5408675.1 sugar ABC transporter substrate-binding protein [Pseudomonas sp. TH34]MBK5437214.1 sugar ABC transporter substrate-binding protein [Pseudomonas sp. TH32]MBV6661540.1 sugar ABC transporter substrate-binding protein [Pseudomonas yamanorum]MCS3417561.1 inositol transport system substrate-binding protein [Pseudomonas sp. BIGb0558]MCS3437522.1 inositol transport system substrate-binding protein [Pseudomonas s
MKTPIRFTALALSMMLASGFATAADIKVGVSMSAFDDTFLTYLREDMDKQAKSYPKGDGVQLQFEDARADVVKQLSQVENFISQKVDAIIVNPVDTASTANISKAALAAGIPLVYVNRRPDQTDLPKGIVAVTSNDVEAGRLQMQYIAEKLGGKGKIVILLGDLANNSTTNRTKGVKEVLAKYPDIKIEQEQTGIWLRDKGMTLVNDWLTQGREFNAVLANNDEMAIGASMALKSAGTKPGTVLIAGVDGTPDGLNAITKGDMAASAFQDANGQAVGSVEAARKMARHEPVEQNVVIPFKLITPDNVKDFK